MQALDVIKWLQGNENYLLVDGRWFTSDGTESVELTASDVANAYHSGVPVGEKEAHRVYGLLVNMCSLWGCNVEWLKGPGKENGKPLMKRVFWLLARKYTPMVSLKTIGDMVGVTDHTTVVKGLKNARGWYDTKDELFMDYYNRAERLFITENLITQE